MRLHQRRRLYLSGYLGTKFSCRFFKRISSSALYRADAIGIQPTPVLFSLYSLEQPPGSQRRSSRDQFLSAMIRTYAYHSSLQPDNIGCQHRRRYNSGRYQHYPRVPFIEQWLQFKPPVDLLSPARAVTFHPIKLAMLNL